MKAEIISREIGTVLIGRCVFDVFHHEIHPYTRNEIRHLHNCSVARFEVKNSGFDGAREALVIDEMRRKSR